MGLHASFELRTRANIPKVGPIKPELAKTLKHAYLTCVSYVDAQIGRLVAELKRRGEYDDALIIVTADHGEEFWDHGGFDHGTSLYDELIHVPLIVKPPASLRARRRVVSEQVRTIDIMPTLLDLVGVPSPETSSGRSLRPLMAGVGGEHRPAFSESVLYGGDKIAWRTGRFKFIITRAVRGQVTDELYDLAADPRETTDRTEQDPQLAERLRAQLLRFYDGMAETIKRKPRRKPHNFSPKVIRELKSLGYVR